MKKIPLSRDCVALVDDEDYVILSEIKWHCIPYDDNHLYAAHSINNVDGTFSTIKMHRLIMGLVKNDPRCVDHINGNGLDNRRSNLRVCQTQENSRNRRKFTGRSQYKGVGYCKSDRGSKKWRARIKSNGKLINIGRYHTEQEAAVAYNNKARELFGEFSNLNQC